MNKIPTKGKPWPKLHQPDKSLEAPVSTHKQPEPIGLNRFNKRFPNYRSVK
jgi:hypothetical protein